MSTTIVCPACNNVNNLQSFAVSGSSLYVIVCRLCGYAWVYPPPVSTAPVGQPVKQYDPTKSPNYNQPHKSALQLRQERVAKLKEEEEKLLIELDEVRAFEKALQVRAEELTLARQSLEKQF